MYSPTISVYFVCTLNNDLSYLRQQKLVLNGLKLCVCVGWVVGRVSTTDSLENKFFLQLCMHGS